jgi:preprotein translocase SecE subunit
MANPITQYLKETRSELNHVAWPTQRQTIVYTILVAALSIGVAAYIGVLDFGFKDALLGLVNVSGSVNASNAIQVTQQPVVATTTQGSQPAPTFGIPGTTPHTTQ